jgi:hypothetical protein
MIEAQNKGREKTQVFADAFLKTNVDTGVKLYQPTTSELQQFQDTVKPVWPWSKRTGHRRATTSC